MENGALFSALGATDPWPGEPFGWTVSAWSPALEWAVAQAAAGILRHDPLAFVAHAAGGGDLLKPLYASLFPRAVRHALGEYYTPGWLAEHVLDQVGYHGQAEARLLDPTCGSGTFLLAALRRWRQQVPLSLRERAGERGDGSGLATSDRYLAQTTLSPCPSPGGRGEPQHPFVTPCSSPSGRGEPGPRIVGFDLHPLAVASARANYLLAIADLVGSDEPIDVPVFARDAILDQRAEDGPFDYVVGNPPWIAWDNLPGDYREATKPFWQRYGLFSLSGNEARHGGGKKDLAMLVLYTAADRYLAPTGRLGMVITQTLFQTKGAGDGFRRFRIGVNGPPLRVLRVDDLVEVRPFGDAANWTSVIILQRGEPTVYPVPYVKWCRAGGRGEGGKERRGEGENSRISPRPPGEGQGVRVDSHVFPRPPGEGQGVRADSSQRRPPLQPTDQEHLAPCSLLPAPCSLLLAQPIDPNSPTSPWIVRPQDSAVDLSRLIGKAEYTAHLGANSGGANAVYWLTVQGRGAKGVRVCNVVGKAKHRVESVEVEIEPDLLYPLVRWKDVDRWLARPSVYLLLAQDPQTRAGLDEECLRRDYPQTFAYLKRFESLLTARAAYRRYQDRQPFYSMYNVGPYTLAAEKVIWRRMDRRIRAAVVETLVDPLLGPRPVIPQETCVLIACASGDEAHYLCALLNSSLVHDLVASHSVAGGKGFGTPSILDYLPLRKFDPADPRHGELSALSRHLHAPAAKCPSADEEVATVDRLAAAVLSS